MSGLSLFVWCSWRLAELSFNEYLTFSSTLPSLLAAAHISARVCFCVPGVPGSSGLYQSPRHIIMHNVPPSQTSIKYMYLSWKSGVTWICTNTSTQGKPTILADAWWGS